MALALVIGTMIGGGIYVLPASLAPLGWNAAIGWIISGLGAVCLAASLRFLMQDTGEGFHSVIERVLGPIPAFLAIWAFWTAGFVSIGALCVASGTVASDLIFTSAPPGAEIALALAFLTAITAINLAGTRSAGGFQILTVIIKLLPLALSVLLITAFAFGGEEPQPMAPVAITFEDVSQSVAVTLFALLGFEMVAIPVQKIRNPGRNIPVALLGGTAFVVLIYIAVSTGLVLMLPWEQIAASSAPVADLLALRLGPVWGTITALCVLVAMIGCVNGLIFVQGDCAMSMARRGEIPASFAKTNSRGVAHWGILVSWVGAAALILANISRGAADAFTFLVLITGGGVLVFYVIGVIAVVRTNRMPMRWPVILAGLGFSAFATYGTGLESALWVWPLLGLGLVLRWFSQKRASLEAVPV